MNFWKVLEWRVRNSKHWWRKRLMRNARKGWVLWNCNCWITLWGLGGRSESLKLFNSSMFEVFDVHSDWTAIPIDVILAWKYREGDIDSCRRSWTIDNRRSRCFKKIKLAVNFRKVRWNLQGRHFLVRYMRKTAVQKTQRALRKEEVVGSDARMAMDLERPLEENERGMLARHLRDTEWEQLVKQVHDCVWQRLWFLGRCKGYVRDSKDQDSKGGFIMRRKIWETSAAGYTGCA